MSERSRSVMITQADVDIANDVCRAAAEKCGQGDYWPLHGLRREDLFNIVVTRVAMQRHFLPESIR